MRNQPRPYVGVTGYTQREQIQRSLIILPERPRRALMAGILVSSKTMDGQLNKFPGRYPLWLDVPEIPVKDDRVLNLVHFSTKRPEQLAQDLGMIMNHAPGLQGVQLNITWPDPRQLADFKDKFPEAVIVLQVGSKALAEIGEGNNKRLASWLCYGYGSVADYILLDISGGKGIPLSAEALIEQLSAIRDRGPAFGLGFAGGLSANTLPGIGYLMEMFRGSSIDAEGALRVPADDSLSDYEVASYLRRAFTMYDSL